MEIRETAAFKMLLKLTKGDYFTTKLKMHFYLAIPFGWKNSYQNHTMKAKKNCLKKKTAAVSKDMRHHSFNCFNQRCRKSPKEKARMQS